MEAAREIARESGRIGGGPARGSSPAPATVHPLLTLQQQAGNQAVQELLRSGVIRAKLAISQPDDPEEREADEVARTIMRSHAGVPVPGACPCSGSGAPCPECEQAQASIHRQASAPGRPTGLPQGVASILRSSGRPLDRSTRDFFEPRFGRDLSHVRVHDGPEAAASARSIQANAYAAGSHIAFAENRFSPATEPGRALLAHELAHTIQQQDQAIGGPNRAAILRQPAKPPAIESPDLSQTLEWEGKEVALGPSGIAGPLPPGTVKDDNGLRVDQKDAEHVEINNGEAWITITADPGAKYSYSIDPLIKRPEPETWMNIFDADAPPPPPPQRVVRIVHSPSSEVRVDSFNPPAEVQQLVVHERYSSDPAHELPGIEDVQERPYGKSSMDIAVQESAIRILTPEDRPVPAPPETYPNGSKFAYSIEPDWTGPSATEKRVFIVASPGVQVVPLEWRAGPAYTYGRKIVPVMIRVTDPGLVPEQGTAISPENFVSQQVYGEVDRSKTLEEQSDVLTASTGLSGVTISEPYSGARVTIRAWQPELGAAYAWQVVPAQGGYPGEIRIVAGPGTYIEFAEPVPMRLRDPNGGATPTPLPKQARIGEGFSTSLRIVQVSDRGKVPAQGTPLNLDYYLQFGELRDPDEHEWLGTNDVPFMIADMFFHAIPVVGELLTIGDCVSSLAKDEDLFGREVDKGGKIVTCAMAAIGLLPFAMEAAGAKMTGGISAAESALKMARRVVNASKLGRSVEEVEVTLMRAAPLVRDAEESARLARASRAMETGEEILEDDLPAVRRALAESSEVPMGGARISEVTGPRARLILSPTELPLEEKPGFAKGAVDKFQATGEVAPEVETAVRQRGGSWEEGRAAVQQTIKDAARDPASGIDAAAAERLAENVPSTDPHADPAEARILEAGKGDAIPSAEQIDSELEIVEKATPQPTQGEFSEEVKLANRHTWRKKRDGLDELWCRFSGGRICVPGGRGKTASTMIKSEQDIDRLVEPFRPDLDKPPAGVKTAADHDTWALYNDYFDDRVAKMRADIRAVGRTDRDFPWKFDQFKKRWGDPEVARLLRGRLSQTEIGSEIERLIETGGVVTQDTAISRVPNPTKEAGEINRPDFLWPDQKGNFTAVSVKERGLASVKDDPDQLRRIVMKDIRDALQDYHGVRYIRSRAHSLYAERITIDEVVVNYVNAPESLQPQLKAIGDAYTGVNVKIGFFELPARE